MKIRKTVAVRGELYMLWLKKVRIWIQFEKSPNFGSNQITSEKGARDLQILINERH